MAHDNWKDYITQFQNTYTDAFAFDNDILGDISWKTTPGSAPDPRIDRLYSTVAPNGLDTGFFSDVCQMTDDQRQMFKTAITYADKTLVVLKSRRLAVYEREELEELQRIDSGLKATDCSKTTPTMELSQAVVPVQRIDSGSDIQSMQLAALSTTARAKQVRAALDAITDILNGDGVFSVGFVDPVAIYGGVGSGAMVVPANENPFLQLSHILGDSHAQVEGTAYLTDLENDNTIILQDGKNEHPGSLAFARTSTMSNYLLASMVCGPTIGDANAVDAHAIREKKQSFMEWALNKIGYGFDLTNRLVDSKSMVLVEYGNRDANALMTGVYGVRAAFRPPSVVKFPGKDAGRNLCRTFEPSIDNANVFQFNPRTVEFDIGGQQTKGLLDVVKKFYDPAILGANKDNFAFPAFWKNSVDTHVIKVLDLFRENFKTIVRQQFIPNFVRTDVKIYNGRTFEVGTAKSLEAQTHLNLLLLGKSMFPKASLKSSADVLGKRQQFLKLSIEFQREMRLELDLLSGDDKLANTAMAAIETYAYQNDTGGNSPTADSSVRDRMQKDFDANQTSMTNLIKQMQAVPNTRDQASPEAAKTLAELGDVTARGLSALVTETGSYYGIIDTIHVEGLQ